jgi:hypothetical protein
MREVFGGISPCALHGERIKERGFDLIFGPFVPSFISLDRGTLIQEGDFLTASSPLSSPPTKVGGEDELADALRWSSACPKVEIFNPI